MPRFSRPFRLLTRLFPPSGQEFPNPRFVSDTVQMMHDLMKATLNQQQVQLFSDFQIVATGGVTTQVLVPEPATGLILFPIYWSVSYDGAANIRVDARVIKTANAVETFGDWLPTAGVGGNQDIGHARTSASIFIALPAIPVPRGNQLRATFNSPAVATNVASNFFGILLPGEIASVETWVRAIPNMTWTVALP